MGWSNQPVVAPVVVIVAGGNGEGLFVYSGTPATGNLIASIAATAGTDAHGNAYQAGVTSYGPVNFSQLLGGAVNLGPLAGGSFLANVAVTGTDLLLQSASDGSAFGSLIDVTAHSGVVVEAQAGTPASPLLSINGLALLSAVGKFLFASDPVNTGQESWHPFTLQASCTAGTDVNGTTYTPAYMLLPSGDVKLRGVVVAPGAGLAAATTWATIPTGYRPGTNIPVALISNGGRGTFSHVYVRPNGNMQFDAALTAGTAMWIDCVLNVQGT